MIRHAIAPPTGQLCPYTADEFNALDVLCSLTERERVLAETVWQAATLYAEVQPRRLNPLAAGPPPVFQLTPVKDGRVIDAMRDFREALHSTREDHAA